MVKKILWIEAGCEVARKNEVVAVKCVGNEENPHEGPKGPRLNANISNKLYRNKKLHYRVIQFLQN